MNYFVTNYFEACKIALKNYAFVRKKNAFIRVKNDVMQNFTLEKLRNGAACRVEFAIIPLCLRIEKEYMTGGLYSYNLRKFEPAHWMQWDQWDYDIKSEESMSGCVQEIIRYLSDYLLPLFECANSCDTALPELIKLEEFFFANRVNSLNKSGIEDRANPNVRVNLSDSAKFYIALKSKDYAFALRSRKALLQQNLDSLSSMSERGYLSEEDRKLRELSIEKLDEDIRMIEQQDELTISQHIIENELYSLENLKDIMRNQL